MRSLEPDFPWGGTLEHAGHYEGNCGHLGHCRARDPKEKNIVSQRLASDAAARIVPDWRHLHLPSCDKRPGLIIAGRSIINFFH